MEEETERLGAEPTEVRCGMPMAAAPRGDEESLWRTMVRWCGEGEQDAPRAHEGVGRRSAEKNETDCAQRNYCFFFIQCMRSGVFWYICVCFVLN